MCFGSTLSYPHKRIFKPAPAPSTSRTRPAASSTRLAQDYNLYTSLAHSQDFLNLLESEHLVCSATATTKTELGIIQLWFNYFAASFYRELGIRFFWEAKERCSGSWCIHSCLPFCVWGSDVRSPNFVTPTPLLLLLKILAPNSKHLQGLHSDSCLNTKLNAISYTKNYRKMIPSSTSAQEFR